MLGKGVISKELRLELVRLLTGKQTCDLPIPINKNFSVQLAEDGGISAIFITKECFSKTFDDQAIHGLVNFVDQHLIDHTNALTVDLENWRNRALQDADRL